MPQSTLIDTIDLILQSDDTNDNGLIDYSEFVTAMRRRHKHRYIARVTALWLRCMSRGGGIGTVFDRTLFCLRCVLPGASCGEGSWREPAQRSCNDRSCGRMTNGSKFRRPIISTTVQQRLFTYLTWFSRYNMEPRDIDIDTSSK